MIDSHGYAIYFSRGLIPFNKLGLLMSQFWILHDKISWNFWSIHCNDHMFAWFRSGMVNPQYPYLLHLGIQVRMPLIWKCLCALYYLQLEMLQCVFFLTNIYVPCSTETPNVWYFCVSQSFDSNFLRIYPSLPPTPLQLEEDLEQLKVLENGYRTKVLAHMSFHIISGLYRAKFIFYLF